MKEFDELENFYIFLVVSLRLAESDPHIGRALLEAFSFACHEEDRGEERSGLDLRLGRWVVRDDDLDLFGTIKNGLIALASSQYAFADLTISGLTSTVLALLNLLRNAHRRGAAVSPAQVELLAILKDRGPCSVSDLATARNSIADARAEQQVREELVTLTRVTTRNDVVAFVAEDATGRWSVRGL
jgi:hypothetical protein